MSEESVAAVREAAEGLTRGTLWPFACLMRVAPGNNEMILDYIGEHVLGLPRSC